MKNKLAKRLSTLLRDHDLTYAQLSRATGVPPQTLNNWAAGQDPRNIEQLKAVAEYFNISVDELCFGIKEQKQSIQDFSEEINAGVFEVVLRRIKK